MRYIDQSLAPGEEIVQRGKWPVIFWIGAWAALLVLGIAIVGIFIFLRAVIIMSTTDFAVTNKRVVVKRGWLNRRTAELSVESVEGVALQQSIWARLFGYGRVVVTGTGDAVLVFPPMAHPVTFRRAIETARTMAGRVHIDPEDRDAIARGEVRRTREEREIEEDMADREADEAAPPRRRRHRSFIGMR